MTCQLSKVIERILGYYCSLFFEATNAYGQNQFAYTRNRGYRDCLAFNICCWLKAFHDNKKVGLYCSDVSGAFDRVCSRRMLEKLEKSGLHKWLIQVIVAWLHERTAYVLV